MGWGFQKVLIAALAVVTMTASAAKAVPAFAVQTGQPCQSCHVGGFGPQLTPFGRAFKLGGFTSRTNTFNVPVSAMVVASYLNTQKGQPPTPGFAANDNFAVDQVSLFLAGGLGAHLGALIQTTYDGIARAFTWDNLDVRATATTQIKKASVTWGVSLNNSPTVEDVWNTLPAWGFPYTSSDLAPSPSASPLLSGALAQTTLGVTPYVWINSELYLTAGAYGSPNANTLTRLGADPYDPGSIDGLAPYGRVAFQAASGRQNFEIGAFGMRTNLYPQRIQSTGSSDRYTDLGLDASWQMTRSNSDVITLNTRFINEQQALAASYALGLAANTDDNLRDVRFDASYYYRDKVGFTVAWFDTTGSSDALLYAGDRTLRPNSTGVTFQLDGTPWGAGHSPLGQRFNMRVGLQYSFYSEFNGAGSNYDGVGGKASDNNAFRVFTWLAY